MNLSKEEIKKEIQKFFENFNKSVEEIKYDSWPLWWFFRQLFITDALPTQFIGHKEIIDKVKSGKKPNRIEKIRNRIKILLLRKLFEYSEKSKTQISRFNKKESKIEKNKKTVMFLIHTNAIIFKPDGSFEEDRFQSLIDEVRNDSGLQIYLSIVDPLTHNSFLKLLKYENLIYRYITPGIIENIRRESSRLNKEWNKIKEKIIYNSKIENLIWEYNKPALNFFFSKELIYILLFYYEAYKDVIKKKDIKLLSLYAIGGPIIRCAIAAADRMKIRSIHIFHGLDVVEYLDLPESLYHCVPGDEYKKKMIRAGINSNNIFVTGPAFMNEIVPFIKTDSEINAKTKRILFASNPTIDERPKMMDKENWYKYLKKYLNGLSKLRDTEIIVKPHPREKDITIYKSIIKELDRNIKLVTDHKKSILYSLIRGSDIVITFGSTVSLESTIIGTPTIIIDIIDFSKISDPFLSGGHVKHVSLDAEIPAVVDGIINNPIMRDECIKNGKKFVQDYLYKIDGEVNKRILYIMKKLIETNL